MKPLQTQESEPQEEAINPETNLNNVYYFPAGQHLWRQQGNYLVCRECVLHHAEHIGMDKIMVGEEKDGTPILRDRASI